MVVNEQAIKSWLERKEIFYDRQSKRPLLVRQQYCTFFIILALHEHDVLTNSQLIRAVNERFTRFADIIAEKYGGDLQAIKNSKHYWLIFGKKGGPVLLREFKVFIIRTVVAMLIPVFLRITALRKDGMRIYRIGLTQSGEELYRRWVEPALLQDGIFKTVMEVDSMDKKKNVTSSHP